MSDIYLIDVAIRCPSDTNDMIPDDARLFIVGSNKVKRIERFAKEPKGPSWILSESIQMYDNPLSTKLTVMMEYPIHHFKQLGFVELGRDDVLAQRTEKYEIVRPLLQDNDGPQLQLIAHCVIIPPDNPPEKYSSKAFEDAIEEETFKSRLTVAILRGQKIGEAETLCMSFDVKYDLALQLSNDNPDKPMRLMRLGDTFRTLYQESLANVELDLAITAYQAAVTFAPGHRWEAELHKKLGLALVDRMEHSNEFSDIENAVCAFERWLTLTPDCHDDKHIYLNTLGICFCRRFDHSGERVDIDHAIAAHERAVHLTNDDNACCLSNLGNSLICRYKLLGELVDLDKAIFAHERAAQLTPDGDANKAAVMGNLASSLMSRFQCSGDFVDINKAIFVQERVLHLKPDAKHLHNLGVFLLLRFRFSRDLVDIDKAISTQEQAMHLTPDGHPDIPNILSSLGNSFGRRFSDWSQSLIDIDKAISAHERAVYLTPDGYPKKRLYLGNLAISFGRRFSASGDIVDLNKAIFNDERALYLHPDGHIDKPKVLNSLGGDFRSRFERFGDLVDADKSISAYERALHLTPDGHAEMPSQLSNLGSTYILRYRHSGDIVDNDKGISIIKQALHLTPDGDPNKPTRLNNLGRALSDRFKHSGELVDIEQSISVQEEALHLIPDGHPGKSLCLNNLGNSFFDHFSQSRDLADSSAAISYFHLAAIDSTGSPSARYGAALQWARSSLTIDLDLSSALQGYAVALDLLPRVASLGQTILARHRELTSTGHVTSEAAAAAISAGQYDMALEWLEQGRCIVWNQLLNLRTPVDALRDVNASLADDIIRTSRALELASTHSADSPDISIPSDLQLSMEQVAQHHRRLAEEWERLVKRARDIPGFEDFLQPKKVELLHTAADAGPVVIINIDKLRCDALVLVAGLKEVMHIPLDHFPYKRAKQLHESLNQLLLSAGVRARDTRAMRRVNVTGTTDADFPLILSDIWSNVVKPVLDGLAFTASCTVDPPRIWWCATGPLAFLPIHAAGIYDKGVASVNISDYVVSSYIPTLNALINAAKHHEECRTFQGILTVSQPNTPGQSVLPNTTVELAQIKKRACGFSVHVLEGSFALVESVVKGMEANSWVHLACHAVQDTAEPTRSALCLYDGCLDLATIITKSFPHADFAFLSACQTATGDEKLSEEAIHLAAGLMLAGYGGTIATMWSIQDKDGPVIADSVYSDLFSDTEPDSTRAALALHHAVKYLRQKEGDLAFLSWVPFIHMGI
ncbi:hypothetical protein PILCRDRAFT_825717 [Piloderma croceum F 1598]|uniref:CHAT domain-containing protein n=1 Tax=Piloderma croceum (strain F 1598) TaxID=765440 RepID=A0A0C3ASQ1_PILCF|nr:hypothetical protein PILCRDRAFT_825717 [Piloderma croceum F 1598]